MSWEQRNGKPCYYRSCRIGGRVVKEYFGFGPVAVLASLLDDDERAEREAEQGARRQEHEDAKATSEALAAVRDMCRDEIADTLHAEGFHRHHGTWRRRRER